MNVRFKVFYAEYWNVFPNTPFKLVKLSNSRASAWLDMRLRGPLCVPVGCLETLEGMSL
jgi:hypothetical protein